MRVLQISKFYPPDAGGIETAAFELTEGLNRAGVRSDVLCVHAGPGLVEEEARAGYRVTRVPTLTTMLSLPIAPGLLRRAQALMPKYDLLHVHMPNPMAALALWLFRPEARLVVHWHSDIIRQRISGQLYAPLQRWVLARADAVIATSAAYAQASLPLQPWRDKLAVVPIGIADPVGRIPADALARVRARHAGLRLVVAVGRLTGYKGFEVLIRAARALPSDCRVVIVGAGDLQAAHQREVDALGLGDRVLLTGGLPEPEMLAHLAAADVFCLPSLTRAEAYGIVMLEAMACGKPVVSTAIAGSGVPWINPHGETGLTVPPGDAGALAQALIQLLDNPGLARRMGDSARMRFEQHFRADNATLQTIALYRRLLTA